MKIFLSSLFPTVKSVLSDNIYQMYLLKIKLKASPLTFLNILFYMLLSEHLFKEKNTSTCK